MLLRCMGIVSLYRNSRRMPRKMLAAAAALHGVIHYVAETESDYPLR